MADHTRRAFLGGIGVVTVTGLAGCGGGGDGGDGDDGNGDGATVPGDDYPTIDEWLTETSVGPADDTYDGVLRDATGQDTVEIAVGAAGNGGDFAFGPSALLVDAGTTIEWRWTGQGNPHNVEAEPDDQLGESDYEFSSGEATGGSGVQFTRTLEESGVALYHCEPHLSLGMKGGIAVE